MVAKSRQSARRGELASFAKEHFAHGKFAHDVYRKGQGPAVLVIAEIPGISPQVLGLADEICDIGCTAVVPDLFGEAGREPTEGSELHQARYMLGTIGRICISREFTLFAAGRSAPVIDWLRALAAAEHRRCGGPGVGVVGLCFSGGFALAMAHDPLVLAPVLAEPSLPASLSRRHKRSIDCDPDKLQMVAQRCARDGLRVLGLRFHDDPLVPAERFAFLREQLGDGFVAVELAQTHGHPDSPMPKHHSVLTRDLIDEPGEPTRAALDQVLDLFRAKLLT
jgi:dienelactone hydrolase